MRILTFISLFYTVNSYKFLAYSPQFATSHMNFMAKISDALVDAGHEVVMLAPIVDRSVKGPGTTKARVITLPHIPKCEVIEKLMNEVLVEKVWTYERTADLFADWELMMIAWAARCNATVNFPGLIEQLKEEKFDVAFGEILDFCMPGLFHLIGIDKWAVTDSMALNDGHFFYTQTPTNPAYVPGLMTAEGGEAMNFLQRLTNVFIIQLSIMGRLQFGYLYNEVFAQVDPTMPTYEDLAMNNSLVFFNSEPLVDFPRPSSARMIDIGGISVADAANPLNDYWSSILDLRPKNVIISFGSFAKAYLMPAHYKKTMVETMKKFPDVTFILKYEKPEDRISEGIENLVETTWMPQNDILHDPRLSAFVTHCGQGSMTEANYAGVPLIVIPVAFDQLRNAEQMRRIGVGIVLEKKDLGKEGAFEEAIREILENPSYIDKAHKLKETLLDRPFPTKEIFIRNMEFLAKHGPLRQLDHYGRHLNFFQYYLIDVIGALIGVALVVLLFTFVIARAILRCLFRSIKIVKVKSD